MKRSGGERRRARSRHHAGIGEAADVLRLVRAWLHTNVGLQRQPGFVHVTVRLPLGDITAGQMHVLADLAEAYADGTARLTIGQNVLFRWVKVGALQEFYQRLAGRGPRGRAARIPSPTS